MGRIVALLVLVAYVSAEQCRHGDNPNYRINGQYCDQIRERALCYESSVREHCCQSCERLEIPGARADCRYGNKLNGCETISARQCRTPYYNDVCCRTCRGTDVYCVDNTQMLLNGYRCSEFLRYKGANNCYRAQVITSCCQSCERLKQGNGDCKFGDKKLRQFTDGATGVIYRCETLRPSMMHKCAQSRVREDCCQTCASYRGRRDVTQEKEDLSEERRDLPEF